MIPVADEVALSFFRTAVSVFTVLVSKTVFGTFQTAKLPSGPQKQCKSLKSEPSLLRLTDFGIIQHLLPLIKWNHALLRDQ